jgi:hypothetical protein
MIKLRHKVSIVYSRLIICREAKPDLLKVSSHSLHLGDGLGPVSTQPVTGLLDKKEGRRWFKKRWHLLRFSYLVFNSHMFNATEVQL